MVVVIVRGWHCCGRLLGSSGSDDDGAWEGCRLDEGSSCNEVECLGDGRDDSGEGGYSTRGVDGVEMVEAVVMIVEKLIRAAVWVWMVDIYGKEGGI